MLGTMPMFNLGFLYTKFNDVDICFDKLLGFLEIKTIRTNDCTSAIIIS
jgi:hypothetical protein